MLVLDDRAIRSAAELFAFRKQDPKMRMVPKAMWKIDDLGDPQRRERLLKPLTPEALLEDVAAEAMQVAQKGGIRLCWEPCRDKAGFHRVLASIPLAGALFDQLFNSRAGYRAQFYLSVGEGHAFNRAIVECLTPAIRAAHARQTGFPADWQLVLKSLGGGSSKVWISKDQADLDFMKAAPIALRAPRWVDFWRDPATSWGLRLPLPSPSQVHLKGAFIRPEDGKHFPTKRDRGEHLHEEGWPR